ncbi:glycosyltransferase [Janibacter sp. LM]|uniref:glycosyltransferase n=1 Tax=Janibacter sp. LM TaxID=3144845 RepID=UPI0031F640FF
MRALTTDPAAGDTPLGRVPGPDSDRRARLDLTGTGWTLRSPWRRGTGGTWQQPGALDDGLERLDHVHALVVDAEPTGPSPDAATTAALATFVTRAIARGTFVVGDLPAVVSRRVHADVPGAAHGRPGDLAFDVASVRQRRQVLAPRVGHSLAPTVSVLLATRRPHLLDAIAAMLRAQTYRRLEVVVAVHGGDPDDLPRPDLGDLDVRVIATPADRSLGHALALAAEAASGELLTKVDDDDHYGPDHVLDLVIARHVSGAPVVGKSSTVVHVESLDTTVRRVIGTPESLVHRVAGGTILVGADELRALGGWADVPRAVDSALMRAATAAGAAIYRPHDIGYVYVRHAGEGHTWSADAGHFLANAREQWLGLLRHPDFGT